MEKSLKTNWNLERWFNPKNFYKEREITIKKVKKFLKKWSGVDLKKVKNLKNFLNDYENLAATYPGIFSNEYFYYFLKNLLNKKDKRVESKLNEIRNLRKGIYKKIDNLSNQLKNLGVLEKSKILKSKKLFDYKNFLEKILFTDEFKIDLEIAEENDLRVNLDAEIKKYGKRLFIDKRFSNKILKKYAKLGEKIINLKFKILLKKAGELKIKFPYYAIYINEGFDLNIVNIIKKIILENKKFFNEVVKKMGLDFLCPIRFSIKRNKISLKEAILFISRCFNKVDKSLSKIVLKGFENGLIDVWPGKNKQLTPRIITTDYFQPNFVLLNFKKNSEDLLHFAHELGHFVNMELIKKNERALNSYPTLIVKEIIAAFFENLFLESLKDEIDDLKIFNLIKLKLKMSFVILFGRILFEEKAYKIYKSKGKISIKEINKIFKKSFKLILGNQVKNLPDYLWIIYLRRGVFSATVYLVSEFAASNIVNRFMINRNFKNKFLKICKTGKFLPLEKAFKILGIDVYQKNFWLEYLKLLKGIYETI